VSKSTNGELTNRQEPLRRLPGCGSASYWDDTTDVYRQMLEDVEVLYGLSFSSDKEWIMWNSEYRVHFFD
jgi:hypothetical protein